MLAMAHATTDLKSIGLVLDPIFAKHNPGPGHPEQVARYTAITKQLMTSGLAEAGTWDGEVAVCPMGIARAEDTMLDTPDKTHSPRATKKSKLKPRLGVKPAFFFFLPFFVFLDTGFMLDDVDCW